MLTYYQYVKVKTNSECHQKFLTILAEEKRINEKVREFSKLHHLDEFNPSLQTRTFTLRGSEYALQQRFGNQIVNHYAYVFYKFKKDSEMWQVWREFQKQHKLNPPSAHRFFKHYCITNDFKGCLMNYFAKDGQLFFRFNSNQKLEFNTDFVEEIDQEIFEEIAKNGIVNPITFL